MRPNLASTMYFCTARDIRNAPRRCTFITASQSSTVILNSRLSRVIPALLIRIVGAPSSVATRSTAAATDASSATFAPTASAWPPADVTASTVAAQADSSRSRTATACPSRASFFATAAPMPRAAPVTIAVLFMKFSIVVGSDSGPGRDVARLGHEGVDALDRRRARGRLVLRFVPRASHDALGDDRDLPQAE